MKPIWWLLALCIVGIVVALYGLKTDVMWMQLSGITVAILCGLSWLR